VSDAWAAYARFVRWVTAAPRRAALLLLLALVAPVGLCVRYFTQVHAGMQDLLPDDSPTVRAITALHARFGGGAAGLIVLVRSPDPAENRRFVRALGEGIAARRLPLVRAVQYDVSAERAWIRAHAPLLIPRDRFDHVVAEARAAIDEAEREANPMFIALDDEEGTPEQRLRRLRDEADREAAAADRFPSGFIASRDGRTALLRVTMAASDTEVEPAAALDAMVRAEVARLRPGYRRDLLVAYNGEVANLLEEHAAILSDVGLSSLLVTLLVGLLIVGYYRSARALLAVLTGVVPGVIATFAVARLAGSTLNSNSAFLGSIIIGNGINYPLLLLAYYRAQPADLDRAAAIVRAARQSLPGVSAAAATASAAYLGLTFTSFRGFSQFGATGGVGMLTVALVTYLATPVGIALFDPPRCAAGSTRVQDAVRRWYADLPRARAVSVATLLALAAVGGVGLRRGLREGYWDADLRDLRNSESVRSGAASWDRTVSAIFGTWLTPVVALAPSPGSRDGVVAALHGALVAGPRPMAERVETVDRYAPPADEQRARIAALDALRRRVDALPQERVPADARAFLDEWLPREGVAPIDPATVPPSLRGPFAERDGRTDRTVLVFPSLAIDFDDVRNVVRFAERVNAAPVPAGSVVGGAFLVMAEIMRVLQRDAVRVIGMVCLLVTLALVPIFGRRPLRIAGTVLLVTGVAVGSQLAMLALGVRLNMLNFAALPITIGVGADYLVNLLGAGDALRADAREASARMGGAILLCSLTTIVGYVTLLLASSGALRSFGQAAVLGEVVAVTIVLGVYPALAPWRPRTEEPA
jgi:predicted RND superfamily exporter protein